VEEQHAAARLILHKLYATFAIDSGTSPGAIHEKTAVKYLSYPWRSSTQYNASRRDVVK
jgi:hypothetical protein